MEIVINKIEDGYVHLHDASNYVREALSQIHGASQWPNNVIERAVTTHVADFMLHITVRHKGSLDGYTSSIPLLDNYTDRVKPRDLTVAVKMIKAAFES